MTHLDRARVLARKARLPGIQLGLVADATITSIEARGSPPAGMTTNVKVRIKNTGHIPINTGVTVDSNDVPTSGPGLDTTKPALPDEVVEFDVALNLEKLPGDGSLATVTLRAFNVLGDVEQTLLDTQSFTAGARVTRITLPNWVKPEHRGQVEARIENHGDIDITQTVSAAIEEAGGIELTPHLTTLSPGERLTVSGGFNVPDTDANELDAFVNLFADSGEADSANGTIPVAHPEGRITQSFIPNEAKPGDTVQLDATVQNDSIAPWEARVNAAIEQVGAVELTPRDDVVPSGDRIRVEGSFQMPDARDDALDAFINAFLGDATTGRDEVDSVNGVIQELQPQGRIAAVSWPDSASPGDTVEIQAVIENTSTVPWQFHANAAIEGVGAVELQPRDQTLGPNDRVTVAGTFQMPDRDDDTVFAVINYFLGNQVRGFDEVDSASRIIQEAQVSGRIVSATIPTSAAPGDTVTLQATVENTSSAPQDFHVNAPVEGVGTVELTPRNQEQAPGEQVQVSGSFQMPDRADDTVTVFINYFQDTTEVDSVNSIINEEGAGDDGDGGTVTGTDTFDIAQVETGSYTGNGAETGRLVSTSFRPTLVILTAKNASDGTPEDVWVAQAIPNHTQVTAVMNSDQFLVDGPHRNRGTDLGFQLLHIDDEIGGSAGENPGFWVRDEGATAATETDSPGFQYDWYALRLDEGDAQAAAAQSLLGLLF